VAERARGAKREERGLGARRGEPHLLRARHRPADLVGQRHDRLVDEEERRALLELLADRGDVAREQGEEIVRYAEASTVWSKTSAPSSIR
jgi:hypothetical protein